MEDIDKFLNLCERNESGVLRQMEVDLKTFKDSIVSLREPRRDKFMKGVAEHGKGFLTIPAPTINILKTEEFIDLFYYTAQPRWPDWSNPHKPSIFK